MAGAQEVYNLACDMGGMGFIEMADAPGAEAKLAFPLEPENKVLRALASPDPDITHALDCFQYLVTG